MTLRMTKRQAAQMGIKSAKEGKTAPKKQTKGFAKGRKSKKVLYAGDALFDRMCREHGLPLPVSEYRFNQLAGAPEINPDTGKPYEWRFDHLFQGWLALEIEGGAWTNGAHTRGKHFLSDMKKYNTAALMGYTVIRCTPQQIESGEAFALVKRALEAFEELS